MEKSGAQYAAKHARLRVMKRRAGALLLFVALLYVVAASFRSRYPWLSYVAAAAEAGIVGAMADWFAVVALFHHPLNLRFIPHTNVIPGNRERIAQQLGDFIQREFVSVEAIAQRIADFNPGLQLGKWALNADNAALLATQMRRLLSFTLNAFDDSRITHFLHDALLARAGEVDFMGAVARLLDVLTQDERHHVVLMELLGILGKLLEEESTRAFVARELARQIWALKVLDKLKVRMNERAARKLIDVALNVIREVRTNPDHELRQRLDEVIATFIRRLREDEALRTKLRLLTQNALESPALRGYVEELWKELRGWLQSDLSSDTPVLQSRLAATVQFLGGRLHDDKPAQQWINDQIVALVPPFIHEHRADIGRFVENQVNAWTTEKLVSELEYSIGADLQYIRINGTLVGAAVGLIIYSATRLVS